MNTWQEILSTFLMQAQKSDLKTSSYPKEWYELVVESHKTMHDNNWVPAETLIIGLPGEKADDVQKTIDLIKDLSKFKSIIVPLYFVPIGNLGGKGFFRTKHNIAEHWQLLSACIRHNIKWSYRITMDNPPPEMGAWKIWTLRRIISYIEKRIEKYLKLMDEGTNPLEYRRLNKNN